MEGSFGDYIYRGTDNHCKSRVLEDADFTITAAERIPTQEKPVFDKELPRHPLLQDMGTLANAVKSTGDVSGYELQSEKQRLLETINMDIGTKQVTATELQFSPDWILEEAIQLEISTNSQGVYTERSSCILSSTRRQRHRISLCFQNRYDGNGDRTLKARLILHGNCDQDRYTVRRNSNFLNLAMVRLLLSMNALLRFELATADVKGPFMQSGGIKNISTFDLRSTF